MICGEHTAVRKEERKREKKKKNQKKEREKREKERENMSRVTYYQSAFSLQKDKLNILAEMLKISKSGCIYI